MSGGVARSASGPDSLHALPRVFRGIVESSATRAANSASVTTVRSPPQRPRAALGAPSRACLQRPLGSSHNSWHRLNLLSAWTTGPSPLVQGTRDLVEVTTDRCELGNRALEGEGFVLRYRGESAQVGPCQNREVGRRAQIR